MKEESPERAYCFFFRLYKKLNKTDIVRINKRNIEARSLNHCCRGKASSPITYAECVSVDLLIQHALRMRNNIGPVAICGLSSSNRFCYIIL